LKKYLVVTLLVITLLVGCSPKVSDQGKTVNNYYGLLTEKKWEDAYNLLSGPSKDKFSMADFSEWAKLVDSAQGGYGEIEIVRETKVTEYGENLDLKGFGEVTVVLANAKAKEATNTSQEGQSAEHGLQTVVVEEKGEFKVYIQELKKAPYYKALGEQFEEEKKYSEAITQFEKAVAEDKDDVWAKSHLAQNLVKLNKDDQALPLLEEVIKQNENVLAFTAVEELRLNLIESYELLINIKEKQGTDLGIDKQKARVEKLKEIKFEQDK